MKNRIWVVGMAALAMLAAAGRPAVGAEGKLPPEAEKVVAKTASWNSYRANFSLEAAEEDGKPFELQGAMLFKKPNQRRLEIREPGSKEPAQLLASDGKIEWQYYPQEKVAYRINNPPEPPGPHRPFNEANEETLQLIKKEGGLLYFEADPKQSAVETSPVPITKIRLEISEADGILRQMTMLGEKGEPVLTQKFTDVQVNPSLPADQFRFTVPDGVTITDVPVPPKVKE